jgi:hypothetical protein
MLIPDDRRTVFTERLWTRERPPPKLPTVMHAEALPRPGDCSEPGSPVANPNPFKEHTRARSLGALAPAPTECVGEGGLVKGSISSNLADVRERSRSKQGARHITSSCGATTSTSSPVAENIGSPSVPIVPADPLDTSSRLGIPCAGSNLRWVASLHRCWSSFL